jgi:SulP family sulfate permease
MIAVALATALTGVLLFCLGLARAGGAIRFIPYPVIGGFLSATGWMSSPIRGLAYRPWERC